MKLALTITALAGLTALSMATVTINGSSIYLRAFKYIQNQNLNMSQTYNATGISTQQPPPLLNMDSSWWGYGARANAHLYFGTLSYPQIIFKTGVETAGQDWVFGDAGGLADSQITVRFTTDTWTAIVPDVVHRYYLVTQPHSGFGACIARFS